MNRDQSLAILTSQFALMPGDDPKMIAMGYAVALDGKPDWAVIRAVKAFLHGDVEDQSLKYRPAPPMVAAEVKRQIWAECNRQNAAIHGEQRVLKDRGSVHHWKHRRDELVTPETVEPNRAAAIPSAKFAPPLEWNPDKHGAFEAPIADVIQLTAKRMKAND